MVNKKVAAKLKIKHENTRVFEAMLDHLVAHFKKQGGLCSSRSNGPVYHNAQTGWRDSIGVLVSSQFNVGQFNGLIDDESERILVRHIAQHNGVQIQEESERHRLLTLLRMLQEFHDHALEKKVSSEFGVVLMISGIEYIRENLHCLNMMDCATNF